MRKFKKFLLSLFCYLLEEEYRISDIEYFKINETLSYQFYQMPKELFKNPLYMEKLSLESKVTYTLLLERLRLSRINKWFNENGEIYLIYTRLELINELKISKVTASKIFKELSECNLIKEERLGQGKPNKIYIGKLKCEDLETYKNRVFRSKENELLEVQNRISRSLKENTNNTDNNNTNSNNINREKIFFDEKVSLYIDEIEKLVNKYGIDKTAKFIVELNSYKVENQKECYSDFDTILRWVVNKVEKSLLKFKNMKKNVLSYQQYEQREYENLDCYYDNL